MISDTIESYIASEPLQNNFKSFNLKSYRIFWLLFFRVPWLSRNNGSLPLRPWSGRCGGVQRGGGHHHHHCGHQHHHCGHQHHHCVSVVIVVIRWSSAGCPGGSQSPIMSRSSDSISSTKKTWSRKTIDGGHQVLKAVNVVISI